MKLDLILFSALMFTLVFSIFLMMYWQRRLLVQTVFGWFNRRVATSQTGTGAFRDQATMSVLLRLGAYTVLPLAAWFLLNSIPLIVLSFFLAWKVPRMVQAWRQKRRLSSMERDLPIALAMFASALSGGVSLSVAIQTYTRESKTALSMEFAYLLRLQRLGVEFDVALEQVAQRVHLADFELVALAMRISKSVGGNLSETLLTLSQAIQQKLIIEGKIRALTSQGVMQAWVMSLLPVMVGGMLTLIQPEQMDKLFHSLSGNLVLGFCCVMDYVGFKVIKKILSIDV
jgi:tight adherence protein B